MAPVPERKPGPPRKGRVLRLVVGWVLVIVGLILGPVPILPGFVLFLPGLAILTAESRVLRSWLRRLREQHHVRRAMREAERVGIKIDLGLDDSEAPPGPPDPSSKP